MNATFSTRENRALTPKDLDELLRVVQAFPKPKYALICPDGRTLCGEDPWKLAAASGVLPDILKADPAGLFKEGGNHA